MAENFNFFLPREDAPLKQTLIDVMLHENVERKIGKSTWPI